MISRQLLRWLRRTLAILQYRRPWRTARFIASYTVYYVPTYSHRGHLVGDPGGCLFYTVASDPSSSCAPNQCISFSIQTTNNQANPNQSTESIILRLCCPGPQPAGEGSVAGLLLPKMTHTSACSLWNRRLNARAAGGLCLEAAGCEVEVFWVPGCIVCRLLSSIG